MQNPQAASSPLPHRMPALLRIVLFGIVLLAAVPELYLGATQRVEYDGYWNVFIAQQDRWQNLIEEYQRNPHPPLYYLFLRAALWFGRSPLTYRAVSILTALATIYLVGSVASRLMRHGMTPALAALAYGLAMPTISIALEVRGYMLCTCFLLISYACFLDAIARDGPAETRKPRIVFAVAASLACLADYYAFFCVGALLIVAGVLALRQRGEPRARALGRELATFAPVLAVMSYLFFTHTEAKAKIWGHLLPYYYVSTGTESAGGYLLRNMLNDFNLFSPWHVQSQTIFLLLFALLLVAGGIALWRVRRVGEPKNLAATVTVVATIIMALELMLVGLFDKYPFGGALRHQFLLFPFLILWGFLLLDRLLDTVPRWAVWALTGILAVAIGAVSYRGFETSPHPTQTLMTVQMETFNTLFPDSTAVYVDQFNLYAFFMHHDKWDWKYEGLVPGTRKVDLYRATRGNRSILVFRDRGRWVLEYDDALLYDDLAACMRSNGLRAIDIFRVGQVSASDRDEAELEKYRKTAATMAARQGLCIQRLAIRGADEYGEVHAGDCDAARTLR
jgi:hypothetical protein